MLLDRAALETLTHNKLQAVAVAMSLAPDSVPVDKAEAIDYLMLESAKQPENATEKPAEAQKPVSAPSPTCTMQQVADALNPFILRGLKVYQTEDGKSWHIRYEMPPQRVKDITTGAIKLVPQFKEETGTLSMPLFVIRDRAATLMTGSAPISELAQDLPASQRGLVEIA